MFNRDKISDEILIDNVAYDPKILTTLLFIYSA